jgi:hypothetical protein
MVADDTLFHYIQSSLLNIAAIDVAKSENNLPSRFPENINLPILDVCRNGSSAFLDHASWEVFPRFATKP